MKTHQTTIFSIIVCLILVILLPCASYSASSLQKASGTVYEDTNRNGRFDEDERGLPGVLVSNQLDVVKTGADGGYTLPVSGRTIIFVVKPTGYEVPLDEFNLPVFYYNHQPGGSPSGLAYKGLEATGKLPASIDFPLFKVEKRIQFSIIAVGDPQTKTFKEVDYYRDDVVSRMLNHKRDFYLALGDIAFDKLDIYPRMNRVTAQLGVPVYNVIGNHDLNFRTKGARDEAETFKRFYGPDYYSFNYGKVHFMVLNSIKYKGWDKKENKKGKYTGFISKKQLEWFAKDLSYVPDDYLVVLAMHIPIVTRIFENSTITNGGKLLELLKHRKKVLALAGHEHYTEYLEYTEKDGWTGDGECAGLVTGSGCGSWWYGHKGPRGVPYGLCTDGAPNGYFFVTFTGNRYTYRYKTSNSSGGGQMRINSPEGTLTREELRNSQINVNVFAGDEKTDVFFQFDNGEPGKLNRTRMKDPLMEKIYNESRDIFPDWLNTVETAHIWTGQSPQNMENGTHRLKITVVDRWGNVFTRSRIFELVE
ncbi:MAG: hypothetical protein GY757_36955 [bacterium]|nr:hypothetical protein [bacterium]